VDRRRGVRVAAAFRERVVRLAELVVDVGANVQSGQVVAVTAYVGGHEDFARAVAAAAYRRGAVFVDVEWFDPLVKRARIASAAEETLGYVPPWYSDRLRQLGEHRAARILFAGVVSPGATKGLDPARVGRDQLPYQNEIPRLISARTTNWCAMPVPTAGWARAVFPRLDADDAYERLLREIEHVLRVDEADPAAAWTQQMATLNARATALNAYAFDALVFTGPRTDLTVGLLPTSRFHSADFATVDGIRHVANLPSEEVFTTPDPTRVDGEVTATRPLGFRDGTVVCGLRVRFEGGRAVAIDADENGAVVRSLASFDAGASRLGEVALVDRDGRVGRLGTVFGEPLLDENATSHLALGSGFDFLVGDADLARINRSAIHVDFMVGGDDVDVTGVTNAGERVPVLRGGRWTLPAR
jgi:aminopeptidase